jgi:hypothetical protein
MNGHRRGEDGDDAEGEADKAAGGGSPAPAAAIGYGVNLFWDDMLGRVPTAILHCLTDS